MTINFSEICDKIQSNREKIAVIMAKASAQTKDMAEENAALEETLEAAMNDAGLKEIKGKSSKAVIKESLRIGIQDYAQLETFLYRKKALHLFERRISSTAYKEMKESLGGKGIPGLSEFLQARLTVSKG